MSFMHTLEQWTETPRWRYAGTLAVVLFFLGCSLVMFKSSLLDGRLYWQADTIMFYYPISARIDEALAAGRLPIWTPYIFGGHPLLADGEAGMLYPIHLLAWWLFNAQNAFLAMRVIRFWLAGLFMYAFLRSIKINRSGSIIGGLTYAFGSFTVGQLQHANVGTFLAWTPLLLRYLELALQTVGRQRLLSIMLAGTVIGLQILTIHINALLMTALLVGSYVAFRCLVGPVAGVDGPVAGPAQDGLRRLGRRLSQVCTRLARRSAVGIAALAIAGAIGLGLGAVQFLPLLELAQFSPRYGGVDYRFATSFALPPANLVTLLFPYFFRDAASNYWSPWFRWDSTLYVGIITLVLALLAIVRVRSRQTVFFAVLTVAGVLLAMGDYLPFKPYVVLWKLPIFSMTRVPSRFTFFAVFGLAVLAAQGANWLGQVLIARPSADTRRKRHRLQALAAVVLIALMIGGLWVGVQAASAWVAAHPGEATTLLDRFYPRGKQNPLMDRPAQDALAGLRYSLQTTNPWTRNVLVWLALAGAILAAWYRLRRLRPLWQALLVLLVAADLLLFARDFHPRLARYDLSPRSRIVDFLAERNSLHRVYVAWPVTLLGPNRLLPYQIADAGGYSSLVMKRYTDYTAALQKQPQAFLNMLDVRYIVASTQSDSGQIAGAAEVFREGSYVVYERAATLPRTYIAHHVHTAGTSADALKQMTDMSFDPQRMVVLEGVNIAASDNEAAALPGDSAVIVSYAPDSVTIQTETTQPGYLVLHDTYYPGWQARVDGVKTNVTRADYLFRAVKVPAGRHTVSLAFQPQSVALGALISLFTGIGLLLAMVGRALRSLAGH